MKKTFIQIMILSLIISVIIAVEHYTNIDVLLSNYFYDFQTHSWFISPKDHEKWNFIFYRGSKQLVTLIGTSCVLYMLISIKKKQYRYNFAAVLVVLLTTMTVCTVVSRLKMVTNIYCPNVVDIYEGKHQYIKIMERYSDNSPDKGRGRCFPAGHVSGIFSLLSLYLIFRDRKKQIAIFTLAFIFGNITGVYQMMRGEHFISHNMVSMILALMSVVILKHVVKKLIELIKFKLHKKNPDKQCFFDDVDLLYIS